MAAALDRCIALDPPELVAVPAKYVRADATSGFTPDDERLYTTWDILADDALAAPQRCESWFVGMINRRP